MKERRYKEDYALEEYIDERGREKRRAVYRGPYFTMDAQKRSAFLKAALPCAALFAASYLFYMKLSTPSAYCMYVLPIAACAVIPYLYWAMGLYTLFRAPLRMTRLQRETGAGRVLRSAAACMFFLGAACAGDLIYMAVSLGSGFVRELPGFALLLGAASCAAFCFKRAKEFFAEIRTDSQERTA